LRRRITENWKEGTPRTNKSITKKKQQQDEEKEKTKGRKEK
jgi:hypothetical protein